jgi:hypothetical protein
MGMILVTVFADDAGEMEVSGLENESNFFMGLADCAGVWAFAGIGLKFATRGAEEPLIGLFFSPHYEHPTIGMEAIQQSGNTIRQRHGAQ